MAPRLQVATAMIRTLTQGTYHDLGSQIRELVTNASDAAATKFVVVSGANSLAFVDNGKGLTVSSFESRYLFLGFSEANAKVDKVGQFGIGTLAVLPTCRTMTIYSKQEGSTPFMAQIDAQSIFEDRQDNTALENGFNVDYIDEGSEVWTRFKRHVDSELTESNSFTCILLEDPIGEMRRLTNDAWKVDQSGILDAIETLKHTLPLPLRDDDPLFEQIAKSDVPRIRKIFSNNSLHNIVLTWKRIDNGKVKTIADNITHHLYGDGNIDDLRMEHYEIIDWQQVTLSNGDTVSYGGYFVFNTSMVKIPWRNPKIRLNNVYVCRLSDIDEDGELKATYPYKGHYAGEIVVVGLKKALKITRDSFDATSTTVREFKSRIVEQLQLYLKNNRERYTLTKEAENFFVSEQNNLPTYVATALNETVDIWKNAGIDPNEIEKKFSNIEHVSLLSARPNLEEELASRIGESIFVQQRTSDDGLSTYFVRPTLDATEPRVDQTSLGPGNSRFDIAINPSWFSRKSISVDVLGTFHVETKHGETTDPAFELDTKNRKVYINFFNSELQGYHLSVFEIEAQVIAADADTGPSKQQFIDEFLRRIRRQHRRTDDSEARFVAGFLGIRNEAH